MNNANLVVLAVIVILVGITFSTLAGHASGHFINKQRLMSSPLRVHSEHFSAAQIEVGQNITISVAIESLINRNVTVYPIQIFQSFNGLPSSFVYGDHKDFLPDADEWQVVDVSEEKAQLYPGETRPFNYTIRALKPGSYHIDSAFEYVVDSPDFSDNPSVAVARGNTIVVTQTSISPFTMHSNTTSGNYLIELSWNMGNQETGNSTSLSFYLSILDARGFPQDAVSYDFIIRNASTDMVIQRFLNQQVDELGSARHIVTLGGSTPDSIVADVIIRSIGRLPVLLEDRATFEIVVVPEFGSFFVVGAAAAVVSLTIVLSRSNIWLGK